ncbi:hypothetical protein BK126_02110 [Paenibacillus sp. FSL H7-0326]|uniref:hypothetical protein n=1 Tax=Paenibacillus sp. FSL H7-0326 TaxID=1921144 RepID=UPI00096E1229|nr:hypothetical protein [Paenibacillus sp. FSL H7-0326]OMC70924.1 hypothetical protein BK126_02110 [Paenibacillus sp. FSL H7-0326]
MTEHLMFQRAGIVQAGMKDLTGSAPVRRYIETSVGVLVISGRYPLREESNRLPAAGSTAGKPFVFT